MFHAAGNRKRAALAAGPIVFAAQKLKEFRYSARINLGYLAVCPAKHQAPKIAAPVADLQRHPWRLGKSRSCEASQVMWRPFLKPPTTQKLPNGNC
jgi:hypothetical protein